MSPDFRAMCIEAIELALWDKYRTKGWGGEEFMYDNNFSYALKEYRVLLARWGRPTPQPPADGEVAELVAWLLREADYQEITCKRYPCADRIRRAAALLERLASPACYVLDPSPEALASYKAADPGIIEALPAELTVLPPLAQPVAVSERWPEFSDCDPQERVWAWNPVLDHWKLSRINRSVHTYWLPANALPTPKATND